MPVSGLVKLGSDNNLEAFYVYLNGWLEQQMGRIILGVPGSTYFCQGRPKWNIGPCPMS